MYRFYLPKNYIPLLNTIDMYPTRSRDILYILAYILCSICILLIARIYVLGQVRLVFVVWNILLATLPVALTSLYVYGSTYRNACITFLAVLFLPNTFYLLTDGLHIRYGSDTTVLLDTFLYVLLGVYGVCTGYITVWYIRGIYLQNLKKIYLHIGTFSLFLVACIGVMLGRMLRWNSWDIFTDPLYIAVESLHLLSGNIYIADTHRLAESTEIGAVGAPIWILILVYTTILYSGYALAVHILAREKV